MFVVEVVWNWKIVKIVSLVIGFFLIFWFFSLVIFFIYFIVKGICMKINMCLVWFWVELLVFVFFGVNLWLYLMRNNEFRNEMMCVFGLRCFLFWRMVVCIRLRVFILLSSVNVWIWYVFDIKESWRFWLWFVWF